MSFEQAQAAYLNRCAPGHRTRRVRWSGGTTQVIELGEGPPLLLLHGGLGEALQWGHILPALARKHRVLAVDRPGHGLVLVGSPAVAMNPRVRMVRIPDAGHGPWFDAPERVVEAIEEALT